MWILIHVISWRQAGHFFEYAAEIKGALKAQSVGNLINLVIAVSHHFLGGIDLTLVNIIGKADIAVSGKKNAQVVRADVKLFCDFIQGKLFFDMFINVF